MKCCGFLTLALALLVLSAGCQARPVGRSSGRLAESTQAVPEHPGGDGEAWLSTRGTMGDAGYCALRVKFPLASSPAWERSYSPAEFTSQPLRGLLHYDGILVAFAGSPSIMVLQAATGEVFQTPFVYSKREGLGNEQMQWLAFSPAGILYGDDSLGRFYAWRISSGKIAQLWLGDERHYNTMGIAADSRRIFTGNNEGLRSMELESGSADWVYPAGEAAWNVLVTPDGTVVALLYPGKMTGVNATSGAVKWSVSLACEIKSACAGGNPSRLYAAGTDNILQCRDTADGALQWQVDFSSAVTPTERQQVKAQTNDLSLLMPASMVCQPNGVALAFFNGLVIQYDQLGKEQWRVKLDAPILNLTGFENCLVAEQAWRNGNLAAGLSDILTLFQTPQPDWRLIPAQPESQSDDGVGRGSGRNVAYSRLAFLDNRTGVLAASFEPELLSYVGLVPAGGLVVIGGSSKLIDRQRTAAGPTRPAWILAYDWLDNGGAP